MGLMQLRKLGSWGQEESAGAQDAPKNTEVDPNVLLPHGGKGDDYCNGDVYDQPWNVEKEHWDGMADLSKMPYLKHIKDLSPAWPHLRYLAQWMQVTTSPVKWQFIKSARNLDKLQEERASRIKVAAVDFKSGAQPVVKQTETAGTLVDYLDQAPAPGTTRLYIVEDLSRDMVETLGSKLDIDPLFFREHISDYLWFNTRDPWVELPDLDIVSRDRSFFRLQYVQPRYFKNHESFDDARKEAGMFNVLRRLDDDSEHGSLFDEHKAIVALVRSKASLWIRPSKPGEDTVGVLLLDPTIKSGDPLWGGYRPFKTSPSLSEASNSYDSPSRRSVFEDTIFWVKQMTQSDIDTIRESPRVMAFRIFQIICAEWLILSRYIAARLGQIEWEVERPDFRPNSKLGIDSSLSKSHTWRRRLPIYRNMISDTRKKLFHHSRQGGGGFGAESEDRVAELQEDFKIVADGLDALLAQTERITAVTTAVAAFEESRRAVEQNRALGRLTYLAVIFAPLSFVSSFFSMVPDVSDLSATYWVYFCVAVPVSLVVYLIVDKDWTNRMQGLWHPKERRRNAKDARALGGGKR